MGFSILGSDEIRDQSNVQISNKGLFEGLFPVPRGVYDPHLGTTAMEWKCHTCRNRKTKCPGHSGSYEMRYPVKSPMFREDLLRWLKAVCHSCGEPVAAKIVKSQQKGKLLAAYVRNVRKGMSCSNCGVIHPNVVKNSAEHSHFMAEHVHEGRVTRKTLYNHTIAEILGRISDETVTKMGIPLVSHPKKLILDAIHVPPNTIRPDIRRLGGGRSNSSHTTSFVKTIVEVGESLPPVVPEEIDGDQHVAFNNIDTIYHEMVKGSAATGTQLRVMTSANRTPNSLAANIPKKTGRIRRNLMGKRVLHAVRSVITGDPTLRIDEIGIPKHITRTISIPETVQPYNIKKLSIYFKNKKKVYPGCSSIRKKANGKLYDTEFLDKKYELQVGDIVYRDLIDGDVVAFNRAPSLTWTSVAAHRAVILEKSNALRCNVSVCSLYNGDFDGDNMTAFIARNIQSRNELAMKSMVGNWLVSYKNSAPMIGAFQDSLVAASDFTRAGVSVDKWHAMALMVAVGGEFNKKTYSSRELFSMLLPKINLIGKKPKQYMAQYDMYLKYKKEDIEVKIDRGTLVSGILDKSTLGQTTMGSVFHIINNEYGADKSLETIFNIQQMLAEFFYFRGFTTGISDLVISEDARLKVKQKITSMVLESQRITEKLDRRELIPPMGTSQEDFFESEQINVMEPGDDFIAPILGSIDLDTNGLAKLTLSGSKGNLNNIFAINAALGNQSINGSRPKRSFSWGRTSPYFLRYETSPDSLGYVDASYVSGIPSHVYPFAAGTARQGVISIALTTSVTGEQNRTSIKNLESIVVDNLRKAAKPQSVVQTLCLESGIDPRRTEKVKFPTVMISDDELERGYHAKPSDFQKAFRNKDVEEVLDEEFNRISEDRTEYRRIMMKIEADHTGNILMGNQCQMPVNVYRVVEDIAYNYKEEIEEKKGLDPVRALKKINHLIDNIPYAYFNETQELKKADLPYHIVQATTLFKILLRSHLCMKHLLMRGINDHLLDVIIDKVKVVFGRSLLQYGTAIGIITAQSISEPMSQGVLDTKHRAGAGGKSETNPIVRIMEIIGVRGTEKMKNPSMILAPLEEYENDKAKVREIASHIEMMKLERFLIGIMIFFEDFGNPVHPRFKHEKKIIDAFVRHNVGDEPPEDLTKWCIRFELSREEMVINHMSIERIIYAIKTNFPDIYPVYTPENAEHIILRCYVRSSMKTGTDEAAVKIMQALRECVVSGVDGILTTRVVERVKSYIAPDGSVKTKKVWAIRTAGSNLAAIAENEYLDISQCQTDSVVEFEQMYGIEAARGKVVAEMLKTIDANRAHCTMYADEMSYSGTLTSIQRAGMSKRERNNVCLRLSFGSPIQVLNDAAVQGLVSEVTGVSAPLIVGSQPKVGTRFNRVCVNEQFIKENAKALANVEDVL